MPNMGRGVSREALIDNDSGLSATSTNATSMHADPMISTENIFGERPRTATSISPEQALIHLIKVMMGTGLLSLPMAFKFSGLWVGLILLLVICAICTYCCRKLVYSARYLCIKKGVDRMDYANVMRSAVESGPEWIRSYDSFRNLVNGNMFVAQLGFCCVYFVFMADNLKQFFDETSEIHRSQAFWIGILLVPILALCTIRELKVLAPLALIGNIVYLLAVSVVTVFLISNLQPVENVKAAGSLSDLPLFFGTVIFAFEGIAVVLPIENQMNEPMHFISNNGVLNTACGLVLAIYATIGFYGYLAFGEAIKDTVTLNLPNDGFYQGIKIMFVLCVLVSYPLQFYVPLERIEKWISRKVPEERQNFFVYFTRYVLVILTCLLAELVPHLALFISLIGAFAGTALALLFPAFISLLCAYSQQSLTANQWAINLFLIVFGLLGFTTGTYSALHDIILAFNVHDI
ncbi:Amino acid transporter, transmembrane family-containing protein [Aphelenchoides besseyi]|nr:Amino acid transporter, transmembrane family-containing protein [Aphelenchoides besseyi]KAI6201112.1 Amino acid transporter, transmembrane family-containing protein [Aphelenchoides besseyi]